MNKLKIILLNSTNIKDLYDKKTYKNPMEMRRIANLVLLSMSNVCFVEDERGDESNVADGDFSSPPATITIQNTTLCRVRDMNDRCCF